MPDLTPPPPAARRTASLREGLTLAALTLAAAAARFAFLAHYPPGLHVDEAFNLLDARAVIDGWRPLFLPANAGRDVLYTYLQAPLIALFGDRLAVARAASALVGTLTVPLVWWMARTITPRGDAAAGRTGRTALTAAALLAVLYWHLHFSRFGIRAILLPAFVAVLLARWSCAATSDAPRHRRRAAIDSGIVLGLAAYAHPAGRALVALPAAHALWRSVRRRAGAVDGAVEGALWRPLAVAAAVGAAIALPLVVQWLAHPWQATGHAAEVSILGLGPAAVLHNAARVAGLFNIAGDAAMWRNVPGRPAFDLVSGAAFLTGLALAVRQAWLGRDWAVLALIALVGLTLPSVLTDGAPNFSRSIGVLPVAVWLAARGAVAVGDAVGDALARRTTPAVPFARLATARLATWTPVLLPALVVVVAAVSTARAYRNWAVAPATRIAFDADIDAFARWVDGLPDAARAMTSPQTADHATYRAVAAQPAAGIDAGHGLVVPLDADGRGTARYVDVARLPWAGRQADAVRGWDSMRLPGIALWLDDAPPGGLTRPPGARASDAPMPAAVAEVGAITDAVMFADASHALTTVADPPRWDAGITLLAAAVQPAVTAGGTLTVTLAWRADGPTAHSLSTAVQLTTAAGAAIASGDGLPVGGSHPTVRWRAGDLVLSRHTVHVPADAPVGPAVVNVGWYVLRYPDGPDAAPRFETVADDRGRAVAGAARTRILPAGPAPDPTSPGGDG